MTIMNSSKVSWIFLTVFVGVFLSSVNSARDPSLQRNVAEILQMVSRIEEQLSREERIRQLTDMVRIDSTMDKINKKLDRLINAMEGNPSGRGNFESSLPLLSTSDNVEGSLANIDDRLAKMESSLQKMELEFNAVEFSKLNDIDNRASRLSDDLNQKLRKMMNIITALYEMNKEIKTNFGGRSEVQHESDTTESSKSNYAAAFLVENLEELERKIKEEFSILGNEIRTEITGLKIVASSVSENCDRSSDYFGETPGGELSSYDKQSSGRSKKSRTQGPNTGRSTAENDAIDSLVQSLGRTTREIKEEISQGIRTIDDKISNLTQLPCGGGNFDDDLQASASNVKGIRVSREFEEVPEQVLDNEYKKQLECTRIAKNKMSPKSCADLRFGGATCDGVYVIFPKNVRAVRVYCDMTTDGGGWTVLMRRGDYGNKMTSFHKNWLSYKNGFGDVEGEFWLGNDVFHLLTTEEPNVLRVHLESFDGATADMTYSSFAIANETDGYRLHIGPAMQGSSSASNSLKYHNNQPFSTYDKKNDNFDQNCASTYKGGWWFNGCYFGFLTGEYFGAEDKRENWQGMLWYDWKGNAALKGAHMMIRPRNFTIY